MLKVNLFFDESGKNNDPIKTMGSLMIPKKVYGCEEIINLNKRLRENEFKLHWTKYNGGLSESKIYRDLINIFLANQEEWIGYLAGGKKREAFL